VIQIDCMTTPATFPLLRRMAAFTTNPAYGNPAGVWIGEALPPSEEMQRIAAEVGFSETAFISPARGPRRTVRYYSPQAEVTFCGHATIASGVVLGEIDGEGMYVFEISVGEVPVQVSTRGDHIEAALTSVPTRHDPVTDGLLTESLEILGWSRHDLDSAIPPVRAWAGAWHLVLAARHSSRLDRLDYDFDRLAQIMRINDLTTFQLVWRAEDGTFHSRNPFAFGGVYEDPATGAAAAALGGYLRDAGLMPTPAAFTILQGEAMGRPSELLVVVPAQGGVTVSGTAVSSEPTPDHGARLGTKPTESRQ